jgi:ParB/Sulfiredoxin domain
MIAEVPAAQLPPILVQRATSRVIDGMHRVRAATIRGEDLISGRLVGCSDDAAFILSVRANNSHGRCHWPTPGWWHTGL